MIGALGIVGGDFAFAGCVAETVIERTIEPNRTIRNASVFLLTPDS